MYKGTSKLVTYHPSRRGVHDHISLVIRAPIRLVDVLGVCLPFLRLSRGLEDEVHERDEDGRDALRRKLDCRSSHYVIHVGYLLSKNYAEICEYKSHK